MEANHHKTAPITPIPIESWSELEQNALQIIAAHFFHAWAVAICGCYSERWAALTSGLTGEELGRSKR